MKIQRRLHKKPRIEVIPMIDVIFFLLVFFMISSIGTSSVVSGIPVSLPQASSSHQDEKNTPPKKTTLILKKDGRIFINTTAVDFKNLGINLAREMENRWEDPLMIQADESVHYGSVIQLMDQAKKVGVRKFSLATKIQKD